MTEQDWQRLVVLCDEPADRDLFLRLRRLSPLLETIPAANVTVYPARLDGRQYEHIQPLMIDDRPDFIVLHDLRPLLVVELTEHGYTGDNPLQRFTRLAAAAENGVPVIYFGPFARVRDDELDLVDDPATLSKRRVNTDLFKGMSRLSEIFEVPVAAVEWVTGANGKPMKVSPSDPEERLSLVFGALVKRVELLVSFGLARKAHVSTTDLADDLAAVAEELHLAWATPNVRRSQTKLSLTSDIARGFLNDPRSILRIITQRDYFFKDKPERLLALMCVNHTAIQYVEANNKAIPVSDVGSICEYCQRLKPGLSDGACFFYTGYKWRSDPHCGVLTDLDYVRARTGNERSAAERRRPLILFYPRIFLSPNSPNVKELRAEIARATVPGSEFNNLFRQRYGSGAGQSRAESFVRDTTEHTSQWTDTTKQARIFRRYCDFIVLADAILLGHHLQHA